MAMKVALEKPSNAGFVVVKTYVIVPTGSESYRGKKITLMRTFCYRDDAEGIVQEFFARNKGMHKDAWAYFQPEPETMSLRDE